VPAVAVEAMLGKERAQIVLSGQRVLPRALERAGFTFRFPHLRDALSDLVR
jgi:NAD dependent epimerase/dehydratase family enzyme